MTIITLSKQNNNYKQIIFEVTKYKKIYFPIDITRKYPFYSHFLLQREKIK